MPKSKPRPRGEQKLPEFEGGGGSRKPWSLNTPNTESVLAALLAITEIGGFGPAKFKNLHAAGVHPLDIKDSPKLLSKAGLPATASEKAVPCFLDSLPEATERAAKQVRSASQHGVSLLTYDDDAYPKVLYESNIAHPILYARGALDVLKKRKTVAAVGSRKISPYYTVLHRGFTQIAVREGFAVVSGFATGADAVGHEAALNADGATIAVMPCGLDRPFPPENAALWDNLLKASGGVAVSEFGLGVRASSLTLRKRNKTIVGLALGVLVSQTSAKGGAMNAYRFALEQKKPVATFRPVSSEPNVDGNEAILSSEKGITTGLGADGQGWNAWLAKLSRST